MRKMSNGPEDKVRMKVFAKAAPELARHFMAQAAACGDDDKELKAALVNLSGRFSELAPMVRAEAEQLPNAPMPGAAERKGINKVMWETPAFKAEDLPTEDKQVELMYATKVMNVVDDTLTIAHGLLKKHPAFIPMAEQAEAIMEKTRQQLTRSPAP